VWQDYFYRHTLAPSEDIVIIKIDEKTLNETQSQGNLKTLTIPKSTYATLVEKLQSA
jgi:CHASE2 domain-containing sensor protein